MAGNEEYNFLRRNESFVHVLGKTWAAWKNRIWQEIHRLHPDIERVRKEKPLFLLTRMFLLFDTIKGVNSILHLINLTSRSMVSLVLRATIALLPVNKYYKYLQWMKTLFIPNHASATYTISSNIKYR